MDAGMKLPWCPRKTLSEGLESLGIRERRGGISKQEKLDLLHVSQLQGMSLS